MLREAEPLDADSDAALHESVIALVGRALALEMQARGLEGRKDRATELLRVVAYITEHLHDPRLNVATLARVFGVSRRNIYNIFLPSRVTPHAWIQNARLDRACTLLGESATASVPVAAIARQCGFSDPAHFSRAFRAGTGSHRPPGAIGRAESGHSRPLHGQPWPLHKMASATGPSLLPCLPHTRRDARHASPGEIDMGPTPPPTPNT